MKINKLEPQKALNPAYKKFKPLRGDIDDFSTKLQECINAINLVDSRNESEEHLKSPISRFLSSTFYSENEINTKERIDLAIYLGKDATSDVGVLIEAKKPSNRVEFPTEKQLNKKAFQEMLLYYLRERVDYKNNNIKHLIITNGFEWFFFNASDFYNLFYKNSELIKEYKAFRDGLKDTIKNELFYNEIAKKYIEQVEDTLPFVYLDFRNKEVSKFKDKELVNIYKLFSDVHLLGKSFGNDSNQLNKAFYNELLHIIGLEEVKESGKKIIQRKKTKEADYGPLLENTIFTLEDKDYLIKVKNIPNNEEKSFTVGLELCLTWVNRILFLKLLESQLRSYNNDSPEYKFLNSEFIPGFDALNEMFFSALAKPIKERHQRYAEKFKYIPYLNSSLFEKSELEDLTFDITALMDEEMEVFSSTVLKSSNGKKQTGKLNTLEYLFKFLDAYDFSADASVEINDKQQNKTLINASVLGLIFEKINGYKDGSFYTPGTITMFMCRETLRKSVVQKFKEKITDTIETFEDVIDYCNTFFKKEDRKKFNEVVNSIRICDPAVGSGHFLVSALNEMIVIKSELGILGDEDGKKLPCTIEIDNDEIYVSDADGELFSYNRKDPQSLKIQKAIFHEKEILIENCLFGVDINPNSVNICRLRLWIELLKNAYYTDEGELQTLPNIDINIKCGNSLISKFALNDSLKSAFKSKEITFSVEDYKQAVKDYKTTNSKTKKREIEDIISTIKNNLKSSLDNKEKEKFSKALGEYQNEEQRQNNLIAFGESIKKTEKDKLKKLKIKAEQAKKQKEEILNNVIYRNAFEWRFEFPEVLDNDGNFTGFDVIIGNPPYIQLQKMGTASDALQTLSYETFARTGDIYSLFYELGYNILKEKGLLTFITSNKWMRAAYGESLRKFFVDKTNPEILIDFGGIQIFDTATVDTNILMFSRDKNRQQTLACVIKEKELKNLSDYFRQFAVKSNFSSSESWVVLSSIEKEIKRKIEAIGTPLKDWDINIYRGILTGYNEAFIIDGKKRAELIKEDPKSAEIIRPILRGRDIKRYSHDFQDLWLINTHNGFKDSTGNQVNKIDINQYPAIKNHFNSFWTEIEKRYDKGDTPYNLRNCAYMEDFYRPKIIYPEITKFLNFYYDENEFLVNNKCFILTGKYIHFLTAFFNSSLFKYCFIDSFPELIGGTRELRKIFLEKIHVILIDDNIDNLFRKLIKDLQYSKSINETTIEIEKKIDQAIFDLYKLSDYEKNEIGFIEIQ
ncbi:Type IIS restriction enzyme Eco57I [Chryseobacterium gleum]|uniref:site-specific DNA-methyltransferase (adenine-specific) n=3 Tax=Chryseobacterium TaxID=59732 RepID=A0A3S4M5W1_CHRGE|nr:Eco57I restriction-modification methylase domain-containing protein [Chryseobacterium gleum]EFK33527.1 Eco57I restriction endonuclease [Chryseobacterium gleum ATCC 35910]QQY34308.1 Eco57I restriction-modification methylase domain-containing protein [Chryseobacterium gleum]VEE06867.1 Type IIS restriction enzyme Eco57I [Chryseobacterium gleum]